MIKEYSTLFVYLVEMDKLIESITKYYEACEFVSLRQVTWSR